MVPNPRLRKDPAASDRSSPIGRRSLREETHDTSCHRNPAGFLPSKTLLANCLLEKD